MFADDVVWIGESNGLGIYGPGGTLYKGPKAKLPLGNGPFTKIHLTGGRMPEGTHNSRDKPAYLRPSAQIAVHASLYDDALEHAVKWRDILHAIRNQFVNGTWWRETRILSDFVDLPVDEAGRPRVAFNFDATLRSSPGAWS